MSLAQAATAAHDHCARCALPMTGSVSVICQIALTGPEAPAKVQQRVACGKHWPMLPNRASLNCPDVAQFDSISTSFVSRHPAADIANARQGEITATWLIWKWHAIGFTGRWMSGGHQAGRTPQVHTPCAAVVSRRAIHPELSSANDVSVPTADCSGRFGAAAFALPGCAASGPLG